MTLFLIAWGLERALVSAGNCILSFGRSGRLCRLPGITILTATVASCAVGPNFLPPQPPAVTDYLPARAAGLGGGDRVPGQKLVRGGDIPDRWWELFRSPHLNDLITDGIIHNSDLQAAEAAVRIAQANRERTTGQ